MQLSLPAQSQLPERLPTLLAAMAHVTVTWIT
jgi:hypothetical protein